MMLYIVSYYNKKINAFTTPQYIDIEPGKAAIQLKRSILNIKEAEVQKISVYKDLDFYYLGQFDDETGSFILETAAQKLLELDPIVQEVLTALVPVEKEGADNGND